MSALASVSTEDRIRTPARWDAVTFLTVYLVLMLAVPSDQYVPGIGAVGSPAGLWGLAAMLWWVWVQLRRRRSQVSIRGPIRLLVGIFFLAVVVSYLEANLRAIPAVEVGPADNGLLRVISWSGIALVASEGIPSIDRLLIFIRRLCIGGALFATLGLAEFFTRTSLVAGLQIPGLVASSDAEVITRGAFVRSFATANHPLEYGMVLAMVLPIALTLALYDRGGRRVVPWVCAGLVFLALVTSGSRSALIGLAIGVIPLIPTWSRRLRGAMAALLAVAGVAIYFLIPGLAGTINYLFANVGTDSSATSRVDSFAVFSQQFALSPMIGRGFGTYLPIYRIFDNQYLGFLVELGVIGTAAFVALILIPGVMAYARGWSLPASSPVLSKLGPGLATGLLVGLVVPAFFDALSFPKAASILFLVVGLTSCYIRLIREGSTPSIPAPGS